MILQLGKNRWFLGLRWDAFDTPPTFSDIKAEAQLLAANHYALRISDLAVQVGYCSIEQDQPRQKGSKAYSLAARLANAVAEPWFGIFDLGDNQFWYIAVRDGFSILPDGDIVGTIEQIEHARDAHAGFNDWKSLEGNLDTLNELLGNIGTRENSGELAKAKLVPVVPIKSQGTIYRKSLLFSLATAAIIGLTYYAWHLHELEASRKMAAAQEAAKARALASQTLAPLMKPTANQWLSACQGQLFLAPLSKFAWQLSRASCTESAAQLTWKLAAGATVGMRPEGVLNTDGTLISQSINLIFDEAAKVSAQNPITPGALAENLLALRQIAQSSGLSLELVASNGPSNNLPGQIAQLPDQLSTQASQVLNSAGIAVNKPLQKQSFSITSSVAPFAIDFSSVPGMRVSSLNTNLADSSGWKLEGTIYGY